MSYRPKGRHVGSIDRDNPKALGICDRTGIIFKREDLVRQMEWRGDRLVWTGSLVGKPYLDVPNEQLRPPPLKPDPVPVVDPRLPQGTEQTWETITFPVWEDINFTTWENWGTYSDGYPASTAAVRLANLQAGGSYIPPAGNTGFFPPLTDALSEADRLTALQTFNWME